MFIIVTFILLYRIFYNSPSSVYALVVYGYSSYVSPTSCSFEFLSKLPAVDIMFMYVDKFAALSFKM